LLHQRRALPRTKTETKTIRNEVSVWQSLHGGKPFFVARPESIIFSTPCDRPVEFAGEQLLTGI